MLTTFAESEWVTHVKLALEQWHQAAELGHSPLVDLEAVRRELAKPALERDLQGRAKALRAVLRTTIRALGVEGEDPPSAPDDPAWFDRRWRYYALLKLRYLDALPVGVVQGRIGLAEGGQFYREQNKAFSLTAGLLRDMEGQPGDGQTVAALSYPAGAVTLSDRFYIRRKEDQDLEFALGSPNFTATIRGSRQVGKTSLLARGVQRARRYLGARVIYFDLQGVDAKALLSLDSLLYAIAQWTVDGLELDRAIVDRVWSKRYDPNANFRNFCEEYVLAEGGSPVLLAMDEIDRLLLTGFHSEFFHFVRSWHNLRSFDYRWEQLMFLMVISTEPYLLIDDLRGSPFNVGQTLFLDDFAEPEVSELNRRYGSPLTEADTHELFELVGGHPFLTRVALYTLVKDRPTWKELAANSLSDRGLFGEHLAHQHRLIAQDSKLRKALKEIMQRGRGADEIACHRLLKAGLIKRQEGDYVSRNNLYRRYLRDRL